MKLGIPLIIIPCSADKSDTPAPAIDFYYGTGYLPIVRKSMAALGIDYNLAFLSAKYGLVMWHETLSPYDKKLSETDIDRLVSSKSRLSKKRISQCQPSRVIACLPKLYLTALQRMLSVTSTSIDLLTPPPGGIGVQRGFLSAQLTACKPTSFCVHVFESTSYTHSEKQAGLPPPKTALLRFCIGDWLTPWVSGTGSDTILSPPVKVMSIMNTRSGARFTDNLGQEWHDSAATLGLCESLKSMIAAEFGAINGLASIPTVDWKLAKYHYRQANLIAS